MRELIPINRKAVLLGFSDKCAAPGSVEELAQLARTAGYEPVGIVLSSVKKPHPRTFVGKGKLEEIRQALRQTGAPFLLVDVMLTPSQAKNIEDELSCAVLDRTGVILEIFSQRAKTNEGKLQVEMARLQYMLPRLVHKGIEMSRLGGIPGTRGPGEPWLEKHRRKIQRRIQFLRIALEEIRKQRETRRSARKKAHLPLCAIVGYTNAGKSTLFHLLTQADVYIDDRLFATLDTTTRRLYLPLLRREILLTDTVGFIRKLPHSLVEAFRATLEEVSQADFLLIVVDATWDPGEQLKAVMEVLRQLKAEDKPRIIACSKIDLLSEDQRQSFLLLFPDSGPDVLFSSVTGEGIPLLVKHITEMVQSLSLLPASMRT
ncbi:MAG: GTPase HflX [bacterium JZ-2024 1]